MTNAWIAEQRAVFKSELAEPAVWIEVAAMLLAEGTPQQSFESLLNRTLYVRSHGEHQSLLQMLHGGFYGPINRGELPDFIQRIRNSQALVNEMDAAINAVLAGSDLIEGFTDQGLPTDPNGQHQPQLHFGGNIFNDWGGGPGGHDAAAAWRRKFEASAHAAQTVPQPPAGAPPVIDRAPPAAPSPAVPGTPAAPVAFQDPIPGIIAALEGVKMFLPMLAPIAGPYGPVLAVSIPLVEDALELIEQLKSGQNILQTLAGGLQTIGQHLQTIGTAIPK